MSFTEHRKNLLAVMEEDSIAIVYAGIPLHANEDAHYPFEVNSQFFYLTGLERERMILLMARIDGSTQETLFIEPFDPNTVRWTGRMPSAEDAKRISGIQDVRFVESFGAALSRIMSRSKVKKAYFDTYRDDVDALPDYNTVKAQEFASKYMCLPMEDLHALIMPLRRRKDAEEVGKMQKAIGITGKALEEVMKNLKPGMYEYEIQAIFEASCKSQGAKRQAFPTIAGSGINGCMLHYGENDAIIPDNSLILLDLGAKYENYCSDITRTYPASGTFTPRQRQYYELVLKANKAVAEAAKPGMTLKELNDICSRVLAEGLMEMGKINSFGEIVKYYMHGVSHSIGIDTHDINAGRDQMEPGWVISNEPGLYIDEEEIGIRIEDDLLITEGGCIVLSKDIIREPDEIEAFMKQNRQ